jgi:hypothetical protein
MARLARHGLHVPVAVRQEFMGCFCIMAGCAVACCRVAARVCKDVLWLVEIFAQLLLARIEFQVRQVSLGRTSIGRIIVGVVAVRAGDNAFCVDIPGAG